MSCEYFESKVEHFAQLKDFFYSQHNWKPQGSKILKPETVNWRVEVLTGCLRAGLPIKKLDDLIPLFERNNFSICDSSLMADCINIQEISMVKEELRGKYFGVVFDGTCRFAEIYIFIVRYLGYQANIQQRIGGVRLPANL